jgi:hypothetical protein
MFPSEDVWSRFAERGELVQPAGFGARSSNLPDAGSRRTFSGGRNFARGGRPALPAQAVIPAHRRKAHGAQTNCNVGVQRLARCLARSCANGEKPSSPKAGASKPTRGAALYADRHLAIAASALTRGVLRLRWKWASVASGPTQIDLPYSYSATSWLGFRASRSAGIAQVSRV